MFFRQILETETNTYTYILGDPTWHEAVVIDSVPETVDEVLHILDRESMRLAYVLDTHFHADHVTGAGALRARTDAQAVISRRAAISCADVLVDDDDFIVLGDDVIRVISTPGHTPGCVSYRWRDRVFTGDALLIGGCGRTDFPDGDAGALYDSITGKIFTLRDETLVYPGHDQAGRHVSCVGEEKRMNRRLAGKSREEFIAIMAELNSSEPKKIHVAVPASQRCGVFSAS
ncbi:MAG: MBL fold metallo-hydrolase [Gammaproteobacteria bacterium]|nr:MBL fold metallo-hydrolase [Gammaproteobacteria bacterium]